MGRYEKQLGFSAMVIYENLKLHKSCWEDGAIIPYLAARLTYCSNKIKPLYEKYKDMTFNESDFKQYKRDVFRFVGERNRENSDKKKFNFEEEKKKLPKNFLDSIVSAITSYEYIFYRLEIITKEKNFLEELKDMELSLRRYNDFLFREVLELSDEND